ncbi:MAG: outer membrane protein assembly factor BamA [Bacteroidetes bacterium]|nr:outer membrane protein assembly factor BamA [Bacteroidota bacterium]MCL5737176.1 outer membrane protein assembly factor BamA [Bacteroidota bacterium]
MKYLLLLLTFVSLVVTAQAQNAEKAQPLKILGISVEGNKLTDAAAIIRYSGLKIGGEFTPGGDEIRQAIKQLWSLGIFSNIEVLIDNQIGDGAFLLIKVQEYPRLNDIVIKGNDELSEKDIKDQINLVKGQIVNPQDLSTLAYNIKKKYEDKGYLLAQINPVLEPVADTAGAPVNLVVNIDEGKEVEIKSITFSGNKEFSSSDLRGAMDDTHEKVWWMFWRSAKFDPKKYEEDKRKIIDFYRKHGYIDASILSDSIWYSPNKEDMYIHINVYEGKKYYIRHIVWEGNTKYPASVLNERLGLKEGEVYNKEKFDENLRGNKDQTDVASLYLDTGYLTFNAEPEEIRIPPDSIDLRIRVFERNQFHIGEVLINGNTKTEDKVIRRELFTVPGDYFSRSMIIRSVRQLSQMNYFNPEKIKPDYYIVNDSTVNVTYDVQEKSSDTFNMSVGYSQLFGFTGSIGISFNNFDIEHPLQGGAGQALSFNWQFGVSTYYRTFQLGFSEPWFMDTPTSLGVNIFDTRQVYVYDLRMTGASLSVGRRFRWPDDYFRGDWIFTAQSNNVANGGGYYQNGIYDEFSITQVLSRNSTDSPIFPTVGSNVSLSDEIAGPPILPGVTNFQKHVFSANWYTPLFGTNRIVLYSGTTFGVIGSITNHSYISPVEMFFMGGTGLGYIATTPLRGYADRMVGPKSPDTQNGTPIGGKVMFKQTLELRFSLTQDPIPLYLLLFAEGGNVYQDWNHTNIFQLDRSAGVGARVLINPIGLIGFDYGYGFDPVAPNAPPSGWQFQFQFGKSF